MLKLKPLKRLVSCWCKHPSSHFHYTSRFNHPWTRTHVRLLGPCFKTGRKEPFSHQAMYNWGQPKTFTHPRARYHVLRSIPTCTWKMTHKVRCTACWLLRSHQHAYALPARLHMSTQQSHQTTLVPFASPSAISGTFNSLFKVLFNFPSWYLFAIGLEPIFSFRWNLPPNLHSNPKECDSREVHRAQGTTDDQWDSHPQWCFFPKGLHLCHCW